MKSTFVKCTWCTTLVSETCSAHNKGTTPIRTISRPLYMQRVHIITGLYAHTYLRLHVEYVNDNYVRTACNIYRPRVII